MTRVFVDTNVFMRFFTQDDAGHQAWAERLFREASEGRLELVTGPPVLFELAWTLRSAYKVSREQVLEVLTSILALPGLTLIDEALVAEAVVLAKERGGHFADAYVAASATRAGADTIATFNRKDFERLGAPLYQP